MAFDNDYLSLIGVGRDNKVFFYDAAGAGTDTIATIKAAGYFNNTDDDIRMAAGDRVHVYADTGSIDLVVSSVSSGAVTCVAADVHVDIEAAVDGTNMSNVGVTLLGNDTVSITEFTLDDPIIGEIKVIIQVDTDTNTRTVTTATTGVSYNQAGNRIATFNGADDALVLVGLSATRWGVVANTGSVAFS